MANVAATGKKRRRRGAGFINSAEAARGGTRQGIRARAAPPEPRRTATPSIVSMLMIGRRIAAGAAIARSRLGCTLGRD